MTVETTAPSAATRPAAGLGRPRRWLRWLLVILLPAAVVRGCVLDVFEISSGSMEPAFRAGDRLIALQPTLDPRPLRRFDVVVLDRSVDAEIPEDAHALLKRVAALPLETIVLEGGDLFVAPPHATAAPRLVRKPDSLVADLLVPMHHGRGLQAPWAFAGPGTRRDEPDGATWLEPGLAVAVAAYEALVDDGLPGRPGGEAVGDTALAVVVGSGGVLRLLLREGAEIYSARLAPAELGGATLHRNALGAGVVAAVPHFAGLLPGDTVLFWNVDGGLRLFVNGALVLGHDLEGRPATDPGAPLNAPSIEVEGAAMRLDEVTVLRDLHYAALGSYATNPETGLSPFVVPPGQLFVLGDLGSESRDSRAFGPVPADALRGRPFLRYGPWDRAGWLGGPDGSP